MLLSMSLAYTVANAANQPCAGNKGGISHCDGSRFICKDGSISQSKRICGKGGFDQAVEKPIAGKVVSISDGDTLTLLSEKTHIKVRLGEIDAPEKAQPYGQKSRQSLADICFGKSDHLTAQALDRYKRTVARVECEGVDANTEQIRRGMAWVYVQYAKDHNLAVLESEARSAKRGLWESPGPMPPWEWRAKQKSPR